MKQTLTPALARIFKRLHYPLDVMLMCVRGFVKLTAVDYLFG
jgi:hypothetical protein